MFINFNKLVLPELGAPMIDIIFFGIYDKFYNLLIVLYLLIKPLIIFLVIITIYESEYMIFKLIIFVIKR